jgi:hypothetical protein
MNWKLIWKTIGDFFLDRNGDGDDKRFWGSILIIVAMVYLFTHAGNGTDTWVVCGGLLTVATSLLWKASSADSKTPPTPPANPTQGVPQ